MNARERFLAVMNFEPVDRTLFWELGYWAGTVRRWYEEGLPRRVGIPDNLPNGRTLPGEAFPLNTTDRDQVTAGDVHDYFQFDAGIQLIPVNNYLFPEYEEEILEDHGDWYIWRRKTGLICRELKDRSTLPSYIGWPVSNRADWEQLKAERLQPTLEGRLPADWNELLTRYKNRDFPLAIGGNFGFYGTPRQLLGDRQILTIGYDDPALLHDMIDYLADFWIAIYDQVLLQTGGADLAMIWEDMCYKSGPLISPRMVREFMLPAYKKLTDFFRSYGIKVVTLDTDGDCWLLIPIFLEGGITALYPMEVNAGMDVVKVREQFPQLQILGGIDKVQLAQGKDAIDAELTAKVPLLVKQGGYVPYTDHLVPPDVSLENFSYYRERLAELARAGQ